MRTTVILTAIALVSTSCAPQDRGYVTGTVKLAGEPVGPGILVFEPAEPDRRNEPSCVGHINDQGEYVLMCAGRKGAPIGSYRVTVQGGDAASLADESRTESESTSRIPRHYAAVEAGLSATVVPGEQVIDFALELRPRKTKTLTHNNR